MANQEHLERLKCSVQEWNQWRQEHPDEKVDLSRAHLRDANLNNANLSDANLEGADLRSIDLINANLRGANLSKARIWDAADTPANLHHADFSDANLSRVNLSGSNSFYANFSHANLREADLGYANFSHADFSHADLSSANLARANFSHTNFSDAQLSRTIFANNDLSEAKGLLEIRSLSSSYVELYTVKLPQDGRALHFLRGVGVPDEWIDFYRAQMMSPIQYHSCFISYSSKDYTLARRLHADLQDHGVRCWFAPHDLVPGDYFREEIDKAIHAQEKLLLILSEHSMESRWVKYEVNRALNREIEQDRKILYPIRVDDTVLKSTSGWATDLRAHRHIGDFTDWQNPTAYQEAFTKLLQHLKLRGKS
jgi:hypothetical protein